VHRSLAKYRQLAAIIPIRKTVPEMIQAGAMDAFCQPSVLSCFEELSGVESHSPLMCAEEKVDAQERRHLLYAVIVGYAGGCKIEASAFEATEQRFDFPSAGISAERGFRCLLRGSPNIKELRNMGSSRLERAECTC
jgi:hypothetical protein